jgi:hypothetical protein
MRYVLTLTPRMVAIACVCMVLLGLLLFLLGIEIGKNMKGLEPPVNNHLVVPAVPVEPPKLPAMAPPEAKP